MKWIIPILCCVFCLPAIADDCLAYKLTPKITIETPTWTKEVVQPIHAMNLLHGNVIATLVDNYDIIADITSIEDGFCIALKTVNATIGYSNFLVQIDISHRPKTCAYDAILSHEDEHIRSYISVIDDHMPDLHDAVYSAAASIMPIFVSNAADIDGAVDELNAQLQSHPNLLLIKQKLRADEEIRNKRVDQTDDGSALRRCMDGATY